MSRLDLTQSLVASWNCGGMTGAVVCARSLLETIATYHAFVTRAQAAAKAKDWNKIGRLVDAYSFSASSGPFPGRDILARQSAEGWGTKVIDRLSADLRHAFPEMTGISLRNLKYRRAFADAWPDGVIVQQLVAQLPWGHNTHLLDSLNRATSENGTPAKPLSTGGAAMS